MVLGRHSIGRRITLEKAMFIASRWDSRLVRRMVDTWVDIILYMNVVVRNDALFVVKRNDYDIITG